MAAGEGAPLERDLEVVPPSCPAPGLREGLGGCPQGALLLGYAGVNKGIQIWVGKRLSCPSFHAISMLSENTA